MRVPSTKVQASPPHTNSRTTLQSTTPRTEPLCGNDRHVPEHPHGNSTAHRPPRGRIRQLLDPRIDLLLVEEEGLELCNLRPYR